MINAMVTGNLVATPELRTFGDSKALTFRMASNVRWKVNGEWKDVADFLSVISFGPQATNLDKLNLSKGTAVSVRGVIHVREYETDDGDKRYSIDMNADHVELIGPKRKDDSESETKNDKKNGGKSAQRETRR